MFGDWMKKWWELMFWWLPNSPDHREEERQRGRDASGGASSGAGRTASEPPRREASPHQPKAAPTPEPAAKPEPAASPQPAAAPKAAGGGGSDDLTEIKGIGPAIAKKLNGLGIASFQQLAQANAKDVADKLASRPITAERVQGWIAEAKKRAG